MKKRLEHWRPLIKELAKMELAMHVKMDSKRLEYWNHFIEQFFIEKVGGGANVTGPRLRRVKPIIMSDVKFWFNLLDQHNGRDRTPEQMRWDDVENYNDCLGNFWEMVIMRMDRQERFGR